MIQLLLNTGFLILPIIKDRKYESSGPLRLDKGQKGHSQSTKACLLLATMVVMAREAGPWIGVTWVGVSRQI